ncbi:MAG TPA: NUDIX hydrolase [Candidatus Paceibacterota bacterium]
MQAEELVKIVNENMNFLRVLGKSEAHRLGLLHVVVVGAVITSEGKYLLAKPVPGRQDAGQYVFPCGGHVSAGEKTEDALKREVFEELGLKDFKYEFMGKAIFNRSVIGRQENHFFNLYKIISDQVPALGPEDESFKYFTEKELRQELKEHPENFGGAFHFVANRFFQHLV